MSKTAMTKPLSKEIPNFLKCNGVFRFGQLSAACPVYLRQLPRSSIPVWHTYSYFYYACMDLTVRGAVRGRKVMSSLTSKQ